MGAPKLKHKIDTVYVKVNEKYIDSLIHYQKKEINSLEYLTSTIVQSNKEPKFLDRYSYDTLFTVVVTISIFFLGITLDRILKYFDKRTNRNRLKKHFKYLANNITTKTAPQIESLLNRTYRENNINTGIPSSSPKVLTGDFTRIASLNNTDLFNAIGNEKALRVILSNLDYLDKINYEIEKYHDKIRAFDDNIRAPLNDTVKSYFTKLAEYVEFVRLNNPQYTNGAQFYALVNNSIFNYYQNIARTRSITRLHREIIRPIQNLAVTSNIFRLNPIANEITALGKDISTKYQVLKHNMIVFRLEYRKFSQGVRISINALENELLKI